jgi:hypothetical protein
MRSTIALITVALALVLCVACSSKDAPEGAAKPAPAEGEAKPAAAGPAAALPAPAAAGGPLGTGKVLETMDSGGYTYVKVQIGDQAVWAAGPMTKLAVGDTVTLPEGMPMRDFYSRTLDQTFDTVYFVQGISTGTTGATAPAGLPMGHPAVGAEAPGAPAAVEGVEPLEGGVTVGAVFEQRVALSGKAVSLRGKVVKVSIAIMGKNWLHIQDGTGDAKTNDLTVTTDAKAEVGDTVVIKGTVATDKDFGAGYKYDVIIEDAAITKE